MKIPKVMIRSGNGSPDAFCGVLPRWVHRGVGTPCLRAFSIVEVMIASAVVTIGLLGLLQLLVSSLGASFRDTNALVAAELSQEGLEYAYHVRDNNFVRNYPAFPTMGDSEFPGKAHVDFCAPDFETPTFALSGDNKNCFSSTQWSEQRYSLAPQGNFYASQDTVTHFARVVFIQLNDLANPTSANIISIVWWGGSDVPPAGVFPANNDSVDVSRCTQVNQCVYTRAVLTDWKP